MAIAQPPLPLIGEFEGYIKQLRFDIEQRFDELIERIRKRQTVLMEEFEVLHFLGLEKVTDAANQIEKIEKFREQSKHNSGEAYTEHLREELFRNLDDKIAKIRADVPRPTIKFAWEDNHLIEAIDKLGKFDMKDFVQNFGDEKPDLDIPEPKAIPEVLPDTDYPKMSVCKIGSKQGDLKNPFGICIHYPTNNIYVADNENNRIQVFSENGIFLFKFGDVAGKGKLTNPYAIAICGDRVFVTEYRSACILTYDIEGTPTLQLGNISGAQKSYISLLFSGNNYLSGIAFDRKTQGFFVCDNSTNSMHVFDYYLNFQKSFGSNILLQPRDVKLTTAEIIVLDSSDLCLHLFDFNFNLLRNFVARGVGKDVVNPWFFCVSNDGTIYMTDCTNNCIYVINRYGHMLRQIGAKNSKELISPKGIVIDSKDRLIVVDNKPKGCLQTFYK